MFALLISLALSGPPERVDRLLAEGRVDRAERVATRWVSRGATADSLMLRARVREAQGDLEGAVADRISARQLAPERIAVLASRTAELLVVLGRSDEATDWAIEAIRADDTVDGDVRAANRLTVVTLLGDAADPGLLDQAVAVATTDTQRARALVARADRRKDTSDARRALALAPDSRIAADAWQVLAEVAWDAGDLSRADASQARVVIQLDALLGPSHPAVVSATESFAAIAEARAEHRVAIARLTPVLTDDPTDPRSIEQQLTLARNHAALGDIAAAITAARLAATRAETAERRVDAAHALNALGSLRFAQHDYDGAERDFLAAQAQLGSLDTPPEGAQQSVRDNLAATRAARSAASP